MYSPEMYGYGAQSSVIRELFQYGLQRAREIGKENIFDYSLGNPSVAPPKEVDEAILDIIRNRPALEVHGYTPGPGSLETRSIIAKDLTRRFGVAAGPQNLYITCGAAAALKIVLCALFEEGDEAVSLTPYFPEYKVFAESAGYRFREVKTDPLTFQPDLYELADAVNEKTKLLILNSPNNPSGVVYTEENIRKTAALLKERSERYGHPIFLFADEPYRELVYEGSVPFLPNYYGNAIVGYSYSKSLSLPGERIGYIFVPDSVTESGKVMLAVAGAGRALGYVCAPSLMQQVIARCVNARPDLTAYRENRDLLYNALTGFGYTCVHPDGAFYLFVKSPEPDAVAFHERAKKYELLLVPGDSFAAPGYVRLAYCVSREMIERSLPALKKLIMEYTGEQ